ncbi:MAG: transposase, partial [bacterium]
MPRSPRLLLSQSYYHVMTRGNNKNVVFRASEDFQYYLDLIFRYKSEHPFDLYHYCLMPSHTHFQIKTTRIASDFSVFMKKINLAYFHYYRKQYGWVGHFWQDRFKSQAIGKDDYFLQCGKYIELNPVRKRLVQKIEQWPYSSSKFYSEGRPDGLITPDFLYEDLAKDQKSRQKKYVDLFIDSVVEESYKKKIWGSGSQRYNEQQKISRK